MVICCCLPNTAPKGKKNIAVLKSIDTKKKYKLSRIILAFSNVKQNDPAFFFTHLLSVIYQQLQNSKRNLKRNNLLQSRKLKYSYGHVKHNCTSFNFSQGDFSRLLHSTEGSSHRSSLQNNSSQRGKLP